MKLFIGFATAILLLLAASIIYFGTREPQMDVIVDNKKSALYHGISRTLAVKKQKEIQKSFSTKKQQDLISIIIENQVHSTNDNNLRDYFDNDMESQELFYLVYSKNHMKPIKGIHSFRKKLYEKINKNKKLYASSTMKLLDDMPLGSMAKDKGEVYFLGNFIFGNDDTSLKNIILNEFEDYKSQPSQESSTGDTQGDELYSPIVQAQKNAADLYQSLFKEKIDIDILRDKINDTQKNDVIRNYLLQSIGY